MIVYHGGTEIIEYPDVKRGRRGLDFGHGFYVTDIKQQAELWAERMSRIRLRDGIVNVYNLDLQKAKTKYSYRQYKEYDVDGLNFIVANRLNTSTIEQYDIIEGGVANDRVIDTVEAYMSNMMSLDLALQNLSLHKTNNQLCICNQELVKDCLFFVESYKI